MDRTIPYDKDCVCDECGKQGGYDFMGDVVCQDCIDKLKPQPDQQGSGSVTGYVEIEVAIAEKLLNWMNDHEGDIVGDINDLGELLDAWEVLDQAVGLYRLKEKGIK